MKVQPLATQQGPDVPDVLIHLTGRRGARPRGGRAAIAEMDADQRLGSILAGRRLIASQPFDSTWPVVSLTEATQAGLAHLVAQRYEPVGIAFHKQSVFDVGGAPVLYVRGDEYDAWRHSDLPDRTKARAVRYWPGAAADTAQQFIFMTTATERPSQWGFEREWRIPAPQAAEWSWEFDPAAVAFVIHPRGIAGALDAARRYRDPADLGWLSDRPVYTFDSATRTFNAEGAAHWP